MRRIFHISFMRDVALSGIAQMTQAACAMLAGILVSRYLGPSGKGALSVLVTLGSVAILLTTFGLQNPSVYLLGKYKEDRDKIITNNTLVGATGGVVAALVLAAVVLTWPDQFLHGLSTEQFLIYLTAVPFIFYSQFAQRIALGTRHIGFYAFPFFAEGIGLLLGTLALLHVFGDELLPLIILRVGVAMVIAVVLAVAIRTVIRFRFEPSLELLGRQARYGARSYAAVLQWTFLLQSDIVLCNYFLGPAQTGVYSVAISLGLPVTLLAAIVGNLLYQRVAATGDASIRVANTNRVFRVLAPLAVTTAILVGAVSHWAVPILYGQSFDDARVALILLLPGLVSLTLEIALMNFFSGEGYPPVVVRAPLVGLVLNLSANLYVIPRWGINGASLTSTIAYTVVLFVVLKHYLIHTGVTLRDVVLLRKEDLALLLRASPLRGRPSTTDL